VAVAWDLDVPLGKTSWTVYTAKPFTAPAGHSSVSAAEFAGIKNSGSVFPAARTVAIWTGDFPMAAAWVGAQEVLISVASATDNRLLVKLPSAAVIFHGPLC